MAWSKPTDHGSILMSPWERVKYLGEPEDDGLTRDDRSYGSVPDAFDRSESYATGRELSPRFIESYRDTVRRAAELQQRQAARAHQ